MRRQFLKLIAVAPTLAVTFTEPVRAGETGGAALGLCTPESFADRDRVAGGTFLYADEDHFGGYNWSSSERAAVACGMVRLTTTSARVLTFNYDDHSTQDEFTCSVAVIGFSGGTSWSQSQSSGIASRETGAFQFTIPSSSLGYVRMRCTLPKANATALYYSPVVGFSLQ